MAMDMYTGDGWKVLNMRKAVKYDILRNAITKNDVTGYLVIPSDVIKAVFGINEDGFGEETDDES